MSKLITSGAIQEDADCCNYIDPPVQGCHAGGGLHVVIPADWQARIAAGQQVPGCSYHALQLGIPPSQGMPGPLDALLVSTFVDTQLHVPGFINTIPPGPMRGAAVSLLAKLNAGP